MKHLNCRFFFFFFWTHHSCPEFNRWGDSYTCIFNYLLAAQALQEPCFHFKADGFRHLYFSALQKDPSKKMNYFCGPWPNFENRNKMWFPSGTFATSWRRRDKRWASPFPASSTHFQCCQHCSRLRGRGRSEEGFPSLPGPLPPPGFPAPTFLKGDILSTSSLCQFPSAQEANSWEPLVLSPEASTHDQGAVHPNSFTRAPQEPATIQHCTPWGPCFSELRNSCPGHQFLIPLAEALYRTCCLWRSSFQLSRMGRCCLGQPLLLAGSLLPSALRAPPGRGKLGALFRLFGFCPVSRRLAWLLKIWPYSSPASTVPLLLCRAQQTPTELRFICLCFQIENHKLFHSFT